MALNVGELEAVLRAKDELTPVLGKAQTALADLEKSVGAPDKALGGLSTSIAGVGRMFGVTLSAGAMIGFGKELIAQAAEIQDVSERLGVGTTAIQQFAHAAEMGGGSIGDVSASLSYMQKVIAGGGGDVTEALRDMGLDLTAIQQMAPEQMFRTIADAAGTMSDPIRQTAAQTALLGRNAGVFLPAIRDGFSGVANAATTMSEQTVTALDRVDKMAGRVWQGIKVGAAEAFTAFLDSTMAPKELGMILEGLSAKTKHYADINLPMAKQSQAALAIIRDGWAEVLTATAEASAEGLAQREAVAKAMHEIELREINESILSSEEKNARLAAAEQKFAADKIRIHADAAIAVRDIEEQSDTAILQRKAQLLQADQALEVSNADLSRGNTESIAAAKMAIVTKYAGMEYQARVETLDRLEQAEALHADREFANAEDKAKALLAIHKDYEQQRLILATTSQAALNAQVEQLQTQHLARMAQMGMTSSAQKDASTLTPQQAAATAQHQAALGGLEAAQKQALALGNTDQAQQIQRLIEEEGAAFVRALQDGGAAAVAMGEQVTTSTVNVASALKTVETAARAVAQVWSIPNLTPQQQRASFDQSNADRATNASRGFLEMPSLFSQAPGIDPRQWINPGSSTPVTVNMEGVLMSDDPQGRQAIQRAVDDAVQRALAEARKLPTR